MSQHSSRRDFARGVAAGIAAAALPGGSSRGAVVKKDTLRFIAQSDLRVLDPIWTPAYVTRNHGYCVFDTPFAIDAGFRPHPQMIGEHAVSADGLRYWFELREGLGFHDGGPVRGVDCVASLKRWMARDGHGQALMAVLDAIEPDGVKAFTIRLKEPFTLLLEGLAKVSSLPPFVMPERLAETPPFQQVAEMIGSGPFRFARDEFEPGHRVVYVKNPDYVPRREPPDWASGGKVVKVERVEWLVIPDATTKLAALDKGEADWWENPPLELVPALAANSGIAVVPADPLQQTLMLRFNHLLPPFDNVRMRRAVLAVVDQAEFLSALAGDRQNWETCPSFFTCGTPMANAAGSEALTGKRDFDKAKALIAEAGYQGEKIVVLDAVDQPTVHAQSLVVGELLTKLGLNVDVQAMDWGTLVVRRASKAPVAEGGWNLFATAWGGADMLDPVQELPLRMNGGSGYFGWARDDEMEALRARWIRAPSRAERERLAALIQAQAFEVVPYIPTGQWKPVTAYNKRLAGVIRAPVALMWNVAKT